MKKAVLEQIMLGFVLLTTLALFVATIQDERNTRDRIYDLKEIARTASKTMASHYSNQIDMCQAQQIAINILNQTPTGRYLINNNLIAFQWKDLLPDFDRDGIGDDGEADTITTTILAHPYETFWYKFFDKDSFTIGPVSATEQVVIPRNVSLSFGSEGADYRNMVGTYTLDNNGCVQNPQLILEDSEKSGMSAGDSIGQEFTTPPTYLFLVANGRNKFATSNGWSTDYPSLNDSVTLNHCGSNVVDDTSNPTVTINDKTVNNTEIFFQHQALNGDGKYAHFQIIPKTIWDDYNDFINDLDEDNAQQKYQQFIEHADELNADDDPNNDIDYTFDINDEYYYSMEDLNGGGDQDFNDLVLDSTRTVIPNQLNEFEVDEKSGDVSLSCDFNTAPIVNLTGCPATTYESQPLTIQWEATDNDGFVVSTDADANNGTVSVNDDGTLDYVPDQGFSGSDTIVVQATDNNSESSQALCLVTVERNNPPIISGTPITGALIDNLYSFLPTASDEDNDPLTFSIQNKPSWASFDSATGLLSGTPQAEDVGIYSAIIISVSDGRSTSSLPSFTIQVIEDNLPPELVSNIPDQTATEGEQFTLDISSYFRDPEGEQLVYTIGQAGYDNAITNDTGIINTVIPEHTTGQTIPITVIATDPYGLSAHDTFNITITADMECIIDENEYFNRNNHAWQGGTRSDETYIVYRRDTAYKTYSFGIGCRNKNVNIFFDYKTSSRWDETTNLRAWKFRDVMRVYTNDNLYLQRDNTHTSWVTESMTYHTDDNGDLKLSFYVDSDQYDEYIYIDNIRIESE